MSAVVIAAEAGIPGQEVSAGLPEIPAFAGMTGGPGLHLYAARIA
ncbi:MAG TPA: hypothetical protein VFR28_08690 [Allosphingosinicella sp.]|nr:hypothetical protein [Allosphingosinicella sp.]